MNCPRLLLSVAVPAFVLTVSCARNTASAADEHAHANGPAAPSTASVPSTQGSAQGRALPAGATDATQRLASSPRHGEWVMIRTGNDSVRAWVVYPERRE